MDREPLRFRDQLCRRLRNWVRDPNTIYEDRRAVQCVNFLVHAWMSTKQQIADAIEALTKRDLTPANRTIATDALVDALQSNIEEMSVATIQCATGSPR